MFRAADNGKIRLFADDTNMFIIGSNLKVLFSLANVFVHNVYQWLVCIKLTIKIDKTNYIIFKPNIFIDNALIHYNLSISINNNLLARTSSIKYLGV